MQATHNMQFRNSQMERLARLLHDLLDGELESIGIAFFARKGAKLAAQDAIIGIIDISVDDVARAVADSGRTGSAGKIRDGTHGVEILALEKPQRVRLGNSFTGSHFVVEAAEFGALHEEMHEIA